MNRRMRRKRKSEKERTGYKYNVYKIYSVENEQDFIYIIIDMLSILILSAASAGENT